MVFFFLFVFGINGLFTDHGATGVRIKRPDSFKGATIDLDFFRLCNVNIVSHNTNLLVEARICGEPIYPKSYLIFDFPARFGVGGTVYFKGVWYSVKSREPGPYAFLEEMERKTTPSSVVDLGSEGWQNRRQRARRRSGNSTMVEEAEKRIICIHYDIGANMLSNMGRSSAVQFMVDLTSIFSHQTFEPIGMKIRACGFSFRAESVGTSAKNILLNLVNAQPLRKSTAHLWFHVETADLQGGLTFVGGLYDERKGYGVVNQLSGFGMDEVGHIAHEIGHQFGLLHTHELDAPLDCCGPCVSATTGDLLPWCSHIPLSQSTLMSYCNHCGEKFRQNTLHAMQATALREIYAELGHLLPQTLNQGILTSYAGSWCSNEGEICSCSGVVYYGGGNVWVSKQVVSTIPCSPNVFGHIVQNETLACYCKAGGQARYELYADGQLCASTLTDAYLFASDMQECEGLAAKRDYDWASFGSGLCILSPVCNTLSLAAEWKVSRRDPTGLPTCDACDLETMQCSHSARAGAFTRGLPLCGPCHAEKGATGAGPCFCACRLRPELSVSAHPVAAVNGKYAWQGTAYKHERLNITLRDAPEGSSVSARGLWARREGPARGYNRWHVWDGVQWGNASLMVSVTGCDGKANSGLAFDACGVCGGNSNSCAPNPTSDPTLTPSASPTNACVCKDKWSDEDYSLLHNVPCVEQRGCTNCDNDPRGSWCHVTVLQCDEVEKFSNGISAGFFYCTRDTPSPTRMPTPSCGNGVCETNLSEDFTCMADCAVQLKQNICQCAQDNNLCSGTCPDMQNVNVGDCSMLYAANICGGLLQDTDVYRDYCVDTSFCNQPTNAPTMAPTDPQGPTLPTTFEFLPLFTMNRKCLGVEFGASQVKALNSDTIVDSKDVDFFLSGNRDSNCDDTKSDQCQYECQNAMIQASIDDNKEYKYMSHWLANNGVGVHCNFAVECRRGYGVGWQIYTRGFTQVVVAAGARCRGTAVNRNSDNHCCADFFSDPKDCEGKNPSFDDGRCKTLNFNHRRDFGVADQQGQEYTPEQLCAMRAAFSNSIFFSYRTTNCNVRTEDEGCVLQNMADARWVLYAMYPEKVQM